MRFIQKLKNRPFFIRLFHWEYWPFSVVYFPVYPIWFWYSLRARSFFFFGASNPGIRHAGFLMESKKEIYDLIPDAYKPATLFFRAGTHPALVYEAIQAAAFKFPLVIKPDIGMQGKAVLKLTSEEALRKACSHFTVDFIIQPFIPYPLEVGIFYTRMPGSKTGKITSMVEKEFVTVRGNGKNTIAELLESEPRYILQMPVLKATMGDSIHAVLADGETRVLVPYGNHVRGCRFLDSTHKLNPAIESLINRVCLQIDGFYFGRLDIRFNSLEEMAENKNWCIIELNGAGSEPTHMYDPGHSILFAWKEIVRHWNYLYNISVINKKKGHPYLSLNEGLQMFRENKQYIQKLNAIRFDQNTENPAILN